MWGSGLEAVSSVAGVRTAEDAEQMVFAFPLVVAYGRATWKLGREADFSPANFLEPVSGEFLVSRRIHPEPVRLSVSSWECHWCGNRYI